MDTCSVSYFKNHALRILADLAESGKELVVTRRGKPLAHVAPIRQAGSVELGKLSGTMKIEGDIVEPLGSEEWKACR